MCLPLLSQHSPNGGTSVMSYHLWAGPVRKHKLRLIFVEMLRLLTVGRLSPSCVAGRA